MGTRAERATDVLCERADVGALAAPDANLQQRRLEFAQLQLLDMHAARRTVHGLAAARELVERNAVALERRIHGRHLLDVASKSLQRRSYLARGYRKRASLHDLTFGVAGARGFAKLHRRDVLLVCIEQDGRKLGRLAKQH